jgi:hypothetical protein
MVKSIAITTLHQQQMQHGNKSNIADSRAVCFYLFYPSRTCGIKTSTTARLLLSPTAAHKNLAADTIRSDIIIFSTVRGFYYCL